MIIIDRSKNPNLVLMKSKNYFTFDDLFVVVEVDEINYVTYTLVVEIVNDTDI